jgi:hypothetical protein
MREDVVRYPRYRVPPAIISRAVWLYYRFTLSFRDVEDLLARRGIIVSYESVQNWCQTFGLDYARRLRRRAGRSVTRGIRTSSSSRFAAGGSISGEPSTRAATSSTSCCSPAGIATPQRGSFANCSKRLAGYHVASSPIASPVTVPLTVS